MIPASLMIFRFISSGYARMGGRRLRLPVALQAMELQPAVVDTPAGKLAVAVVAGRSAVVRQLVLGWPQVQLVTP